MCQAAKKRWNNYYRVPEHQAYFEELSNQIGIPVIVNNPETPGSASALVEVFKGGNSQQGTWVHPQVAIHLAMWCSPKFAVQVTQWVFTWMTTGQSPIEQSQPQPQPQTPSPPPSLPGFTTSADLTPDSEHYQRLKAIAIDEIRWRFR